MKITFDNAPRADFLETTGTYKKTTVQTSKDETTTMISSSFSNSTNYENNAKSIQDVMDKSEITDVATYQNELTIMSNCMSEEDFAEYVKGEKDFGDVDVRDAVTIIDEIKLAVIKSGKVVEGFTDTIDPELQKEVSMALQKAEEIPEISDGVKKYFVSTGEELTIENLYLAKHSFPETKQSDNGSYFSVDENGYFAKKPDEVVLKDLEKEVTRLLSSLKIEPTKENVENAVWLVDNSLCVNERNLEKLSTINEIKWPLDEKRLQKAISIAITDGKAPMEADVTKTENIYEQAVRITEEIEKLSDSEVHAKRVLEETRLSMTTKANLMLLRSDYHIDTKDLENYVEALKKVEKSSTFVESKAISDVKETVEEIKALPAAVIGRVAFSIPDADLLTIKAEGNKMKIRFEEAEEKYEQVSTTVRKDLGDSIKKAFRNVDDILREMDLEVVSDNQRAVRILGYNGMEINEENIEKVKVMDRKLTNVLEKLTPSDTINLIRKGTSPLKMSIDGLSEVIKQRENTETVEMEKYSKFLYKLERSENITQEERKEFIDVYRLLYQLEKTGYAAVGSVLKSGKELTFGNLKEAIKTTKNVGMNIKVDDSFGLLVSDLRDELEPEKIAKVQITDGTKLELAYEEIKEAETDASLEEEYTKELYGETKLLLKSSEEVISELLRNDQSVTLNTLAAANLMYGSKNGAFRKVSEIRGEDFSREAEEFEDSFSEKESAVGTYDTMMEHSKLSVFDAAMNSDRYIDVRALNLVYKQLSLSNALARNENYHVPVTVDGEMTDVECKIVHNENEEPNVLISFENEEIGRVSARLTIENGETNGYISCSLKESVIKMKKAADKLGNKVAVIHSADTDRKKLSSVSMNENSEHIATKDLYKLAKRFLEAI